MRLRGAVLILILSTTISCKKDKEPEGILSQGQMVDWMLDIYLAEARTQSFTFSRDSVYKVFLPYQDSIMRQKGISDSLLQKSFQYYFENPAKLEAVYDIVIDSLSLQEQRLLPGPVVKPSSSNDVPARY
ncbi:hypothetical protein BH09BAC3_BH09BAC3_09410 [soil metagenome]